MAEIKQNQINCTCALPGTFAEVQVNKRTYSLKVMFKKVGAVVEMANQESVSSST